jgi:hypothetical protein
VTGQRITGLAPFLWIIPGLMVEPGLAQTIGRYGRGYLSAPYGSSWPDYPPANYFSRVRRYPGPPAGAQTVTDYRPLIKAITSLPGWSGKLTAPHLPARSLPALTVSDLMTADGKILWPGNTPNDTRQLSARRDAEDEVGLIVREHATHGQAQSVTWPMPVTS